MRDLDKMQEKVVIRLDNGQVAAAIIGFIVVSVATFTSGVVVGKRLAPALPDVVSEDAAAGDRLASASDFRRRPLQLAKDAPSTQAVHLGLSGPGPQAPATTPMEAARIEAHRQIAAVQARGVARSLGPVALGGAPAVAPRDIAPVSVVHRNPKRERAALDGGAKVASSFTLQVSVFDSAGPAQAVASQLQGAGHEARVRPTQGADGRTLYRVEVGRFSTAKAATKFQRRFERASGYSTVLVPVR